MDESEDILDVDPEGQSAPNAPAPAPAPAAARLQAPPPIVPFTVADELLQSGKLLTDIGSHFNIVGQQSRECVHCGKTLARSTRSLHVHLAGSRASCSEFRAKCTDVRYQAALHSFERRLQAYDAPRSAKVARTADTADVADERHQVQTHIFDLPRWTAAKQAKFDIGLGEMVLATGSSARMVAHPKTKAAFRLANPSVVVKSRHTLKRKVFPLIFGRLRKQAVELLESAQYIALVTDGGMDTGKLTHYNLYGCLPRPLYLCTLMLKTEKASADLLAEKVMTVVNSYPTLKDKLVALVTDDGSNVKGLRTKHLFGMQSVSCAAHALDHCAEDAVDAVPWLKGMLRVCVCVCVCVVLLILTHCADVMNGVHDLLVTFKNKRAVYNAIVEKGQDLAASPLAPIVHGETRWLGSALEVERFLASKIAIKAVTSELAGVHSGDRSKPLPFDMREIVNDPTLYYRAGHAFDLLKPILESVMFLQSDDAGTLGLVMSAVRVIKEVWQQKASDAGFPEFTQEQYDAALAAMKHHLDKITTPIQIAADMLHPSIRGRLLSADLVETGLKFIAEELKRAVQPPPAAAAAAAAAPAPAPAPLDFIDGILAAAEAEAPVAARDGDGDGDGDGRDDDAIAELRNDFADLRVLSGKFNRAGGKAEADKVSKEKGDAALRWWRNYGSGSILYTVALRLMVIPATEAASERGMSIQRFIKNRLRARMNPETTEQRIAAYHWIHDFDEASREYRDKAHAPPKKKLHSYEVTPEGARMRPTIGPRLVGCRVARWLVVDDEDDEDGDWNFGTLRSWREDSGEFEVLYDEAAGDDAGDIDYMSLADAVSSLTHWTNDPDAVAAAAASQVVDDADDESEPDAGAIMDDSDSDFDDLAARRSRRRRK